MICIHVVEIGNKRRNKLKDEHDVVPSVHVLFLEF